MKHLTLKIFSVIIPAMLAVSCAGYFGAKGGADNPADAKPLAIAGGGYLSTDTHNEVTPFIYRDTNGKNPVLFYSSDRDGTYDIYYARMNPDGTFQPPVKMGTNVNTDTADEISPIVFWATFNTEYYPYIAYLSFYTNTYLLKTKEITSNFNTIGFFNNLNLPSNTYGINIRYYSQLSSDILVCAGGITNDNYYFDALGGQWFFNTKIVGPGKKIIFSGSTIFQNFSSFDTEIWVAEVENNNHRQLYTHAYAVVSNTIIIAPTNQGIPPAYASTYNDRQPCVDWWDPEQKGRVYFSSDRAGTYDLYRYNIETISKLVDYYPFAEWLTNNGYL